MTDKAQFPRDPHTRLRLDCSIQAEVWLALWACEDCHALDISNVDIAVQNGEITLTGSVIDEHQRQMVESLVQGIQGGAAVHNCIGIHEQDR